MAETEPHSWEALASALGTTRRSLQTWRKDFAAECPQTRDVTAWRGFIEKHNLRPCHSWNSPHAAPSEPAPKLFADTGAMPVLNCGWDRRREVLFEIMEFIHAAAADGALNLAEYHHIGTETFIKLRELNTLWNAQIDERGWMENWQSILAKAVLKKDAENHTARAAACAEPLGDSPNAPGCRKSLM